MTRRKALIGASGATAYFVTLMYVPDAIKQHMATVLVAGVAFAAVYFFLTRIVR
jgi:phosphotransferase system  glucose/maltose/N-acetylglucosamine-specific IIC component